MLEIQAGGGLKQLEKMPEWTKNVKLTVRKFGRLLSNLVLYVLPSVPAYMEHACLYVMSLVERPNKSRLGQR